MNLYIIVEGSKTEPQVYPAWLRILLPEYERIADVRKVDKNNYYLFSSNGIPSIYNHIANAIDDINNINKTNKNGYDYLLVCIDTEDLNKGEQEKEIQKRLENKTLDSAKLIVFEQQVCMETWFLGNRKIFKKNPDDGELAKYIEFYNVSTDNPELMGNFSEEDFNTKAQFHLKYLSKMFRERNMSYTKSNTLEVQTEDYLNQLIERYKKTDALKTFGSWFEFIQKIKKCSFLKKC